MILTKLFFSIKCFDVCSTVTKMNSQAGTMMVETPEQYLDIFQCLKDEVTTREVRWSGYIDLDLVKSSIDSEGGDEVIYDKRGGDAYCDSFDQGGEYNNYDQEDYSQLMMCAITNESI